MPEMLNDKNLNTRITVTGYFINYDMYNRAKLMFLDDYDGDLVKFSFTKSYMLNKVENINNHSPNGYSPIIDNKYIIINCPKKCLGNLPNTTTNNKIIKMVPIIELIQHKVECIVEVNKYKFNKGSNIIHGWNLKLIKMTLLEY